MLASKNEIMHFFRKEGFLDTLEIGWEGDEKSYWDVLNMILSEVWKKFGGEDQGFVSYEDVEEIRDYMVQRLQEENPETKMRKMKFDRDKSIGMHSDMIGDFDMALNEARTKEMTDADIRRIVKDEMEKFMKREKYVQEKDVDSYLTKEEVKKMIRKTIVNQYKYLWEKSAFFINNI